MMRDQDDLPATVLDAIAQFHQPWLNLRWSDVILGLIEKYACMAIYHKVQQSVKADKDALPIGEFVESDRVASARINGAWKGKLCCQNSRICASEREV